MPDDRPCDHMTAEQVEQWWATAAERNADVAFCTCCFGPCPAEYVEWYGQKVGVNDHCKVCVPQERMAL